MQKERERGHWLRKCIPITTNIKKKENVIVVVNYYHHHLHCRSQWPHSLRRRSSAARLLRLWVRIPPRAWVSVCCVLSGRGLCDELLTRPEESYRLWCVVECDLETSWKRRPWPTGGCFAKNKQTIFIILLFSYKTQDINCMALFESGVRTEPV